jgi:tRNA (guanine37-N1)-methyltransferase
MRIDILTLFPELFVSPLADAIFKRARDKGLASFNVYNIRDYTHDKHHVVDDYTFGGGAGMLLKPEPVFEAAESVLSDRVPEDEPLAIILMTPQGRLFSQGCARELAAYHRLLIICGHYEGVYERIRQYLVTHEISMGDYVLSGGEIPALAVSDAVVRLIPGVLGSEESAQIDSLSDGLLEYPQYTRPSEFRGWKVPDILLSGDHGRIARWRRQESLRRTLERRPDLLKKVELAPEDRAMLHKIQAEENPEDMPM